MASDRQAPMPLPIAEEERGRSLRERAADADTCVVDRAAWEQR